MLAVRKHITIVIFSNFMHVNISSEITGVSKMKAFVKIIHRYLKTPAINEAS